MTQQEIDQVNAYIAKLKGEHALAEQRSYTARDMAYRERDAANKAIHQIWNLAHRNPPLPPSQLADWIKQIIDYYCPDFDIPF